MDILYKCFAFQDNENYISLIPGGSSTKVRVDKGWNGYVMLRQEMELYMENYTYNKDDN